MKKHLNVFAVLICLLFFAGISYAGEEDEYHQLKPYKGSAEFEKIKTLVGTWKGKTQMGEQEKEITVTYNTASADSIIVERMFPGTPEEMVSVYYDKEGKLSMTHYCALKNQPEMILDNSTDNRIGLTFSGGSNFDHTKDPYMHSLSIDFIDSNNIIHNWTLHDSGKEKATSKFELTRDN